MLDQFIQQRVDHISYTSAEIKNIEATSKQLKEIVLHQTDFRQPFIGGSFKRKTMAKGISDIDLYYGYTGIGNPQSALDRLKTCLTLYYPNTKTKQDKPSILVDFKRITYNITPYVSKGRLISIPGNRLLTWQIVEFSKLENKAEQLRKKGSKYISVIKLLKLWNQNSRKHLKNYQIEEKVCNFFLGQQKSDHTLSEALLAFYRNNGYQKDANRIEDLRNKPYSKSDLKSKWNQFIDNN